MHLTAGLLVLLPLVQVVSAAACPMAELIRRGEAPEELKQKYLRGEGISDIAHAKRQSNADPPPILDPISGIISPIGLGAALPRALEDKLTPEQRDMQRRHVKERLKERYEDANVDAAVLTPQAAKRHFNERGLIGGILAPLTGILQSLDVPTPQESGLKEIPGNDPAHQYQAPGPTDVRGNCPTLNTLANHGYLSRNGITSFAEAANAVQTAYSMSFDLAVGLSALGLLAGGDLVTGKYSIGGQDTRVPNTLGPAYGIDRHGFFEADASISRSDRFFGDSHSFNRTKWDALVSDANQYGGGLFNAEAFKHNSVEQIQTSKDTNPEFTLAPNNLIVHYATRALTYRPLPNGTNPNVPDFQNISPFFLHERFPENWYRLGNTYSFVDLVADIADLLLYHPQAVGRNYNGQFAPLNVTVPNAPGGVACFVAAALVDLAPSQATPEAQAAAAVIEQILTPAVKAGTGCSTIDFANNAGSNNNNNVGVQNANAGSGSGIPNASVGLGQA